MTPTRFIRIVATLATFVATDVAAEPIFASPPHFVADDDGQRIVLFLNEPVSGALAARGPDGGYEIRVPRSTVAPAIQGQDFGADGWGNSGEGVRRFVLASGPKGDTSIRIEASTPLGGVDAHSADDPPRLVIELLASAPTRTPAPVKTWQPPPKPAASKSVVPKATATRRPRPTATPQPIATTTSKVEPVAIAAAPPADGLAHATILTALAAAEEAAAGPAPAAPGGVPAPQAAAPAPQASVSAPHAAPPAATSAVVAPPVPTLPRIPGSMSAVGLGCLWKRFSGVAVCVADPKAPPYVGDHTITALVGALARGKLPEAEDTPTVETPALAFLKADVAFATRAAGGKLLPVVDAYRVALRKHPDFPEAWRARLNIGLAYRAMEFRTELLTVAGEAVVDPTGGLVRGLAGDVAFVTGYLPLATEQYRRAADTGGAGPCLAARGRARVAIAQGRAGDAAADMAGLTSLCPLDIVNDPETTWVRGELALAQQDFATAKARLGEVARALGPQDQGAVIADLGAVAEAAGDPKAARASYERLLGGTFGARAARQATVRLAILDGEGGDVKAGLKRLDRLTPEAADPARRELVMQSARSALERGKAGEAIAAMHDARVDPSLLPLDDQLLAAEAYRTLGLNGEAARLLDAAQQKAGGAAPDALFGARGDVALARGDGAGALAIADDWIRVRGRTGGALALRARAIALTGDGSAAHAAVAAAILEDPSLTRTLALDVAETLHATAPSAALVLAREALEPGPSPALPAAREAVGLALVGDLAETAGDDETALAAFTTLAARYGKEPIAADAPYRAARLAARHAPGAAPSGYEEALKSKDTLARRVAGAARDYEAIVRPLGPGPAAKENP